MKLLIDMNLSPDWVAVFQPRGWHGAHWSAVGDAKAPDHVIMAWARARGYIVFTHDLDFGALLAITRAVGPSVIQVRAQDVLPGHLAPVVVAALVQYQAELEAGALMIVDERTSRVRMLPLLP